jgi:hypothetical protein
MTPSDQTIVEWRQWADDFAKQHSITVIETTRMPAGVAGYANWRTRTVTVPPITDAVSFATRLHEFGHLLAGSCPGTRPHAPDPQPRDWHHCLQCEADAWAQALRAMPFTREMFADLKQHLALVRRTYPRVPDAVAAANVLASDSTFARMVQARAERARRLDAFSEMQAWAAEPRVLTKLEKQVAEWRQWCREDSR